MKAMKKIMFIPIVTGLMIFLAGCGQQRAQRNETVIPDAEKQNTEQPVVVEQVPTEDNTMIDCGQMKDPGCFMNRMNECLPVKAQMIGSDNQTKIDLIILGIEDEKCHFQRKINDVMNLNCYFPKGTMNWDTIDQTFGNDRGLQSVVDDACKQGW
jgi:hypothetical protein